MMHQEDNKTRTSNELETSKTKQTKQDDRFRKC